VLAASVFVGFPHADIAQAGLSAVVCSDARPDQARQQVEALLAQAWQARAEFVFQPTPLAEAVARAKACPAGPVVLLDHCDNSASGGSMDSTARCWPSCCARAWTTRSSTPSGTPRRAAGLAAGIGAGITQAWA
jgi:microcystin degradation protein MlrC